MMPSISNLKTIELALMQQPTILDCAVRTRECGSSRPEVVAYVVPSNAFQREIVHAKLISLLPDVFPPDRYALLSGLPYSSDGTLDEEMLSQFEIVDEHLAKSLEQKLFSVPGIRQAAVVIEPRLLRARTLHISDLIPPAECGAPEREVLTPQVPLNTHEDSIPGKKRIAISCGQPLRHPQLNPLSLPDALKRAARAKPLRDLTCVQAEGSETIQSYEELLDDAEHILGGLRKLGLEPGAKVLFQFDRNQDFISSFWGCILGGFIPVPITTAPTYKELNATIQKLHSAWELLGRPTILTGRGLLGDLQNVPALLNLQNFCVETVENLRASAADHNWHESQPDDTCLMLLTSGSTGTPKAVMQTHRALMRRSAATAQMNEFDETDVFLNWFPLDHVGGIVMSHLMALFTGSRQINVPTEVILQDPLKWLDFIERYHATVTWAPNFAFGLINDREELLEQRNWNLTSMRFILNGGEAIVPRTARKFLQLLAKFGLRGDAMHPAWGMSETCSGVTFSGTCSLDTVRDDQSFVEVGAPIPGVSIRIVDDQDRPREEGQIGRLQVAGPPVTTGYYRNLELTRESLSPDGWFNTGDLGFLRNGCLTITGRAKDVIITNGQNFYCHEVEALVEEVKGANVSFTAACPVRVGETNTDQMAVFFNPVQNTWPEMLQVMKSIREALLRKMGIKPDFIIPLPEEEIPKTAIGKIQRAKLRDRFEAGEFQELLKQIDLESANANTLPAWFHEETWVRRERAGNELPKETYLVFSDDLGLGDLVSSELIRNGSRCVRVRIGTKFEEVRPDEYCLNPQVVSHYQQLGQAFVSRRIELTQWLHLWSYNNLKDAPTNLTSLRTSQDRGTYSVLSLMQAMASVRSSLPNTRLLVVTNHAEITSRNDKFARPEFSSVSGLLLTAQLELPWLECRHLDLETDSPEANARRILRELAICTKHSKVAYRSGKRLEALLSNVDMLQRSCNPSRIKPGGFYLLTGGLGGLGAELARHLATEYHAKLLLLGRTPLLGEADCRSAEGILAHRIRNYSEIRRLSREVRYEVLDITDVAQIRTCVSDAESRWNEPLAGIFHLAGSLGHGGTLRHHWEGADEHLVKREQIAAFEDVYRSKVYGTWALFEVIQDKPEILFVAFSSLNALFGGATLSAYSAANSFLRSFCLHKHYSSHPRTVCIDWSMWDELGMSEASPEYARELAVNMGYHIIRKEQGMNSLMAVLFRDQRQVAIGLDASNPRLRGCLSEEAYPLSQLSAFYVSADGLLSDGDFERLASIKSEHALSSRFEMISAMPLTGSREIDRQKLLAAGRKTPALYEEALFLETKTEQVVAKLWKEVLNLPELRTSDNFFELGGDSLTAMRLANLLREKFSVAISIRELFEKPTIRQLASAIDQRAIRESRDKSQFTDVNRLANAQELLTKIGEIPDIQVDALLEELTGNESVE